MIYLHKCGNKYPRRRIVILEQLNRTHKLNKSSVHCFPAQNILTAKMWKRDRENICVRETNVHYPRRGFSHINHKNIVIIYNFKYYYKYKFQANHPVRPVGVNGAIITLCYYKMRISHFGRAKKKKKKKEKEKATNFRQRIHGK